MSEVSSRDAVRSLRVVETDDAAIFDQILQQLKFHCRQIDRFGLFRNLGAFEVDSYITESKTFGRRSVSMNR